MTQADLISRLPRRYSQLWTLNGVQVTLQLRKASDSNDALGYEYQDSVSYPGLGSDQSRYPPGYGKDGHSVQMTGENRNIQERGKLSELDLTSRVNIKPLTRAASSVTDDAIILNCKLHLTQWLIANGFYYNWDEFSLSLVDTVPHDGVESYKGRYLVFRLIPEKSATSVNHDTPLSSGFLVIHPGSLEILYFN